MRIFSSVSRYIQGPGVLDRIGIVSREFGTRAVLITDADLKARFGTQVSNACAGADVEIRMLTFPGEVTRAAIASICEQCRDFPAAVVLGLGGGKALDTAKGVALSLQKPFISVPTIAATDAPASLAIAVYDDAHVLTEILQLPRNPDIVLVDTAVITAAPLRFLIAGIGDAIPKKFEAEACAAARAQTPHGTPPNQTGLAIADACYRLIRRHALPAMTAVQTGQLTDDVEALIEATVLLSTMSFENAGLSVAHAVAKGFPVVPRSARTLHGMHVAYGLLVQLVLEQRSPEFMAELLDFYRAVGLPTRLADLELNDASDAEIRLLVDTALTSPSIRRFTRTITAQALTMAVRGVERL